MRQNTAQKQKKITLATIKSFVRRNKEKLYINPLSRFDGTVDCVMPHYNSGFQKAVPARSPIANNLGVEYAWCVGSGDDLFRTYEEKNFFGYEVYNCCGSFILAVRKEGE